MRLLLIALSVLISQAAAELTKCSKPVDIVFVIDTSASVWMPNFEKQIEFVHDVVNMLDVGPGNLQSRVSAITFSNKVTFEFGFLDCTTKECVLGKINNITHDQGDATRTYLGLNMVSTEAFASKNGDRPSVENVVVVLTDGQTNSGKYDKFRDGGKKETLYKASVIRDLPAYVFAIGIGNQVNIEELNGIASDPNDTFVITVDTFDELNTDNIKEKLLNRTCEVAEKPQKETKCSELRADIFFVLDESSSIHTEANFKKELTLVAELIDQVDVGETKVQIGVLTFSSRPRMQFHLDKYHTKIELINALAKVRWHGRDTYTNEAIDMLINKGLNQNYGARNGVPQIAVFVTDGRSTRPRLTALAVKVLKETDIISFAIGVGPEYSKFKDELANMASSENHTFHVDDLDKLKEIRKTLVQYICGAEDLEDKDKDKEDPQKEEECKESRADIMFLLDGSTSIKYDETFKKELKFVTSVIDSMDIGPTESQVGIIQFASTPKVEFNLNAFSTKKDVAEAIQNIAWMKGDTYLDLAIDKVLEVMTPDNGLRHDVPHIVVLISDGQSTNPYETKKKIEKLREKSDFIVIGIGVGEGRSMSELERIVTEPIPLHVFEVENQDALHVIRSKLVTVLCQSDIPAEEVCEDKVADIIFVADLSSSIGYDAFDQLIAFIKDVVGRFTIGPGNIQIGLVTYSTSAKTEFNLNKYRDGDEIAKAIYTVTYTTGDTYTHLALEEVLKNGFTRIAGARPLAPHIVIVITDGVSRVQQATLDRAKEAKDQGIIMFSIGVGQHLDKEELIAMASEPTERHFFMVEDYGALENIGNSLASRACAADQSNHRDNNNGMFGPVNRDFLIDHERKSASSNRDLGNIEYLANQLNGLDSNAFSHDMRDARNHKKSNMDQEKLLSLLKKVLEQEDRRRYNI